VTGFGCLFGCGLRILTIDNVAP